MDINDKILEVLYDIRTEIKLESQEIKYLREDIKNNGLADKIANKITKRMAIVVSLVGAVVGVILYVV